MCGTLRVVYRLSVSKCQAALADPRPTAPHRAPPLPLITITARARVRVYSPHYVSRQRPLHMLCGDGNARSFLCPTAPPPHRPTATTQAARGHWLADEQSALMRTERIEH